MNCVQNSNLYTQASPATESAPDPRFWANAKTAIVAHPFLFYALLVLLSASFIRGVRFDDGMSAEHCVLQAKAFLDRRADIEPGNHSLNDLAGYQGKQYIVNPPLPSALLVPLVALLGVEKTQGLFLTAVLTIINFFLIHSIAARYGQRHQAWWLAGAFLSGTGYWFCFTQSDGMWFMAHLVSFTFLLAAVNEGSGRSRGWILGALLGASFLSRQATIHSALFFALLLLFNHAGWGARLRNLFGFLVTLGISVALYLWFNWLRFDNPFDTGYDLLRQPEFLDIRQHSKGLFHWAYIPFNAFNMLANGFCVELEGKGMLDGWHMSPWGTSLTFASPFVFFSLFSRLPLKIKLAAWLSIGLTMLHVLSYHANGWVQINCYRYTLDFMPLLMLLCLTAIRPQNQPLWKGAIIYSIALNALALVVIPLAHMLYRQAS